MRAMLSGGDFHGKEFEIENAFTNIVVRPNKAEGFSAIDAEIPAGNYELVSVNNGTALYRIVPKREISLKSILDAAEHLPFKTTVSKCVCGSGAMLKIKNDPQITSATITPEGLRGVFIVLDLTLPPNVAEMRDKDGNVIQRFILTEPTDVGCYEG